MSFITEYKNGKMAVLKISSAQGKLEAEFPAFLTTFTNSFSSNWSEEQVYGRQDPIGTFQSTKRKINVGFDIVASNLAEAKKNIDMINRVSRMLYPSYTGTGKDTNALVLSKVPLVTIQFGNLLHENKGPLLGWIGSWSANPVLDMGMFTPSKGLFFPKVYNATIDFTPQHKQDLAFNVGSGGNPTKFPYSGG
tara:strand:- start:447 stop:1025 length:579 start_codon:yes stop_codon:yes gene_type:complete